MKIKPTPPPRTPAVVRRRVARTAIGAGAVAAGLVVACSSGTYGTAGEPPQVSCRDNTAAKDHPDGCPQPPQVAPQPPQVAPQPPQVAPQPPQPPQPFDAGMFDADASDAEDAG